MPSTLRNIAKGAVVAVLGNGPLLRRRLDRIRAAGVATILNLHRVGPDDGSSYRPLPLGLFEELLDFITTEYSVVTFADLAAKTDKPKLVLSFDDGYRDYVTHAVPMMRRKGVRSNQNLIPKCVETGLPPLNVLAQDFIGKAPADLSSQLVVRGYTGPRDERFGDALSHFIKMRSQSDQEQLAQELLPQFFDWSSFQPTPMMSADEARSVADQELGAHSWQHASLEYETDEYLEEDISRCEAWFLQTLGKPLTIYALPNGSYRNGQIERIRARGIEHVLLVGDDFDRDAHVHKRFTYYGSSPSEIRFRAAGGLNPV